MIDKFLDWFLNAPLYKSIWFVPLVALLGGIALIKNITTGEIKKS